jgi:hypothetical protein
MALAMMYPEPEKGGRGKKSAALNSTVSVGFSATRLNLARGILHHSRSLAESVLKGITPLDQAVAIVKDGAVIPGRSANSVDAGGRGVWWKSNLTATVA